MIDHSENNKDTVLIALDIAKRTHEALVLLPGGKRLSMKVANSIAGYELLYQRCGGGAHSVICGFEPTADYHRYRARGVNANWCLRCLVHAPEK